MLPAHLISDKVTHVRRCGKFSKKCWLITNFDVTAIPFRSRTLQNVSNRASYRDRFTLFSLTNIGRDDPIGHDTANTPCTPSNERERANPLYNLRSNGDVLYKKAEQRPQH